MNTAKGLNSLNTYYSLQGESMIDFDFTPKYTGPAAQRDKVVSLFFRQLELMGRSQEEMNPLGIFDPTMLHTIDDVAIRAEEFEDDDGRKRRFVAEFQFTEDADGDYARQVMPNGFYVAVTGPRINPATPEGLIRNLWEYMRDNKVGQHAMGEYPVGRTRLLRVNTRNMERLTEAEKKQLIPRANGSFGYATKIADVNFVTEPYDDNRRSMEELWRLCEPTEDMTAGQMAKGIIVVNQTGMQAQQIESEYDMNPRVDADCDQLNEFEKAIRTAASKSTQDGITNWGRVTFYGLPRRLFCTDGRYETKDSLERFREAMKNGETDFSHTEEHVTLRGQPLYASMYLNPRMVKGKLLL